MPITQDQLSLYNGKDGRSAYVVYNGDVYDVSSVFQNGEHNGCMAGKDITGNLENAPHGISPLDNAPKVSEFKK